MKKKLLINLLVSLVVLTSLVTASLYTEKIPDPSRFTSIEPKWSAELEFSDGTAIQVSLIEFEWLSGEASSKTHMMYLNDGTDEYIADKGSWGHAKTYEFICDSGYDDCVTSCGDDEPCIDSCTQDYNCRNEESCPDFGPDGTCGVKKATASFGENNLMLEFDPATGQLKYEGLTFYNDQPIENIVAESGFLSGGVLSAG
jgi:hypothetical protein